MSFSVKCRICRCTIIDNEKELDDHEVKVEHSQQFLRKDYRKKGPGLIRPPTCSHVFILEQSWMESFIRNVNDGSIPCPKCKAKLGTFSWVGIHCTCGGWAAPGFALLKSKIDVQKSNKESSQAITLPNMQ